MTDHGYNIVPHLWNYSAKMVRANHDAGRLVTFLGEEWTSSFEDYDEKRPWGYYGHRNLIFANPYFPKWWTAYNGDSPADLWRELREMRADFVQVPPSARGFGQRARGLGLHGPGGTAGGGDFPDQRIVRIRAGSAPRPHRYRRARQLHPRRLGPAGSR